MTLYQLKALVKKGESDSLEFKESTKQLDRGMETLCAFLNSKDGGTLLFGVTDKKRIIVGQYDSGIEITSVGRLPDDIKLRQLSQKHNSFPRNPHIAGVFHRCKLIEQWGRGTYDMIKRSQEAGYPLPIFKETVGSFTVILPFKEPIQRAELQSKDAKLPVGLTERQKEILSILKQGTLSRDQIMEQLRQAPAIRTLQEDLLKLATINLIVKSGGGSGRFVKWSLNRKFNARSMRSQYAVNAHKPRENKTPKKKYRH